MFDFVRTRVPYSLFCTRVPYSYRYTGEWSEKNDDNAAALKALKGSATAKENVWSVNGYLGLPASWDHAVYTIFWAALFPLAYCAVAPIGLAALGLDHLKSPLKRYLFISLDRMTKYYTILNANINTINIILKSQKSQRSRIDRHGCCVLSASRRNGSLET